MTETRQEKIHKYIHNLTEQLINDNKLLELNGADALNCSLDLKLDRANVSKDMNNLWKAGDLIKIQGKPVYYLDYHSLTEHFPNNFFPSIINKGESLELYLNNKNSTAEKIPSKVSVNNQNRFIGADGSLSDVILNARSAVSYPPHGIPCLIIGNPGVGKTFLANSMYKYLCKIRNDNHIPFYTLYCQNYEDNPSAFAAALLGSPHKTGPKLSTSIFENCENGILLLEQINHLPYSSQNLIASIIKQKQYLTPNSDKQKSLNTMIIATTSCSPTDSKISILASSIPMHLQLLDIDQRGIYEKIELIMSLLEQEAIETRTTIRVHKDIITLFALQKYKNNISDMRNEIQLACSKAYLNTPTLKNNTIYLTYQSLSLNLLEQTEDSSVNNSKIISLLSCIPTNYLQFNTDGTSTESYIFRNAPIVFRDHRISQFVEEFNVNIEDLDNIENYVSENICVLKDCPDAQLQALRRAINPYVLQITLHKLQERPKYNLLQSESQLLYGILLHITNYLKRMQYHKTKEADNSEPLTKNIYQEEFALAKDIYETFEKAYSFEPSSREIDFLASYLAIANQWANHTNVAILVICHGDSIASQLVNYVRSSIHGDYSLDSIDFSSSMQMNDCLELACIKATELNKGVGVMIVCDMEPLTSVGDYVFRETGIPSRTISGITLASLICLVQQSMSSVNDLDALASGIKSIELQPNNYPKNSFIEQIRDKIIDKTVSFINTKKAVNILKSCLTNTLNDLSIPYTDAIAVKYICHCTNMLERVIKNEPWDFQKIRSFYKENAYLIHVIEHNLEYAGDSFGIKIPGPELAYVAQIFLPEFKGELN